MLKLITNVSIFDGFSITEYYNYDLDNIVSPVKPNELEKLLVETNYDKRKTKYLVDGFTNGFDLGYEGPVNR